MLPSLVRCRISCERSLALVYTKMYQTITACFRSEQKQPLCFTHELQLNPSDHRARAQGEGDDAHYNDEAVKQHGQVYASTI